jgi:hypothetical protein
MSLLIRKFQEMSQQLLVNCESSSGVTPEKEKKRKLKPTASQKEKPTNEKEADR